MIFRIGMTSAISSLTGTIYGDGVDVAAQLEALYDPGRVSISQAANDQFGKRRLSSLRRR